MIQYPHLKKIEVPTTNSVLSIQQFNNNLTKMNINNFRMTRDIYKHIYSFMPGLSIRPHLNMIKSKDADDFEFWVRIRGLLIER
jgi:hypothetical protein